MAAAYNLPIKFPLVSANAELLVNITSEAAP